MRLAGKGKMYFVKRMLSYNKDDLNEAELEAFSESPYQWVGGGVDEKCPHILQHIFEIH